MDEVVGQALQLARTGETRAMHTPEDVQAMLKLASLGWGAKRIAKEVGCSRNTVRRYLRHGGYVAVPEPGASREVGRTRELACDQVSAAPRQR